MTPDETFEALCDEAFVEDRQRVLRGLAYRYPRGAVCTLQDAETNGFQEKVEAYFRRLADAPDSEAAERLAREAAQTFPNARETKP